MYHLRKIVDPIAKPVDKAMDKATSLNSFAFVERGDGVWRPFEKMSMVEGWAEA